MDRGDVAETGRIWYCHLAPYGHSRCLLASIMDSKDNIADRQQRKLSIQRISRLVAMLSQLKDQPEAVSWHCKAMTESCERYLAPVY